MTRSAVLFLLFNRPEPTARVFEAIRRARPPRLYLAADGPRGDRPGEHARCTETRAVAAQVDWPCEVHRLFRETNLGCRGAVSSAIDWFFEHESEGIILEDDCLPSDSFFLYCDALLEHYRDDERVMSIAGNGIESDRPGTSQSYRLTRHIGVWGWATWRRAWRLYDVDMVDWPAFRDAGQLDLIAAGEKRFQRYWTSILDRTAEDKIDTWDYQWMFACWAHGGIGCRPCVNLVSNIGFGADATHTLMSRHPYANSPRHELDFPLRHPPRVVRDVAADRRTQAAREQLLRWLYRTTALGKLKRIIHSIVRGGREPS